MPGSIALKIGSVPSRLRDCTPEVPVIDKKDEEVDEGTPRPQVGELPVVSLFTLVPNSAALSFSRHYHH